MAAPEWLTDDQRAAFERGQVSLHESGSRRVVLKYPAPHRDPRTITVTEGAVVVLVDNQEGVPTLWVELDPAAPSVQWHVISVATGDPNRLEPGDVHLGSFVVRGDRWLVWHMYRRPA